ncbi:MAG: nitrous oxide reductase accessory protein NosL [Candidatus Aminicenantes bacterium]|nr:nitrous oxide reductase accessory protein NosL [Candidatus Aminicenantes bacterium]
MVRISKTNLIWVAALGALLLIIGTGLAETKGPVKPSKEDKCPVCGMFVYKYPDWLAEIIFKDESVVFFDGAKDLFKYYFEFKKYRPGKNKKDIAAIYVTEYYALEMIDARKAFFIMGSDVYGPMGNELIPLATEEDARTFMKDHKGKRVLRFEDITLKVIKKVD